MYPWLPRLRLGYGSICTLLFCPEQCSFTELTAVCGSGNPEKNLRIPAFSLRKVPALEFLFELKHLDTRQFKHQTQRNLIVKPNQKGRIYHTPISHWLRNLGYVGFEFTLQLTFGAYTVHFLMQFLRTTSPSENEKPTQCGCCIAPHTGLKHSKLTTRLELSTHDLLHFSPVCSYVWNMKHVSDISAAAAVLCLIACTRYAATTCSLSASESLGKMCLCSEWDKLCTLYT